jgi:hypothetical protein
MLTADDSRDAGWIAMRCKNHPNLRWTRKDPEAMARQISRNPQLMFDGDISDPERKVFLLDTGGESLRPGRKAELEAEGWLFECPCPYSDLEFIRPESGAVAPEPKTVEEAHAFINGLRDQMIEAQRAAE